MTFRRFFSYYTKPNAISKERKTRKLSSFYLNTGVGKAWAGQRMSSVVPASFLNIKPSPMFTLGLTDPIGSKFKWIRAMRRVKMILTTLTCWRQARQEKKERDTKFLNDYLNTGVGNAWAGHKRSKVVPASFRKIVPSPMFTLGLTDPIGSEFQGLSLV